MRQGLRAADVRLEQQRATTARGLRRPEYNFWARGCAAYTLVPTSFAPVLAGDTIANWTVQARVIGLNEGADQVLGSWFEHWLFYVRIGDMADAEAIRDVLIDPAGSAVIDWRQQCMQSIWAGFFRDESESLNWSEGAYLRNPRAGYWDSSRDAADLPDVSGAPDEWNEQWIRYQAMRRAKLTTKTWEEYLGAQGVNVPPQLRQELDPEGKVPELLQYSREFVYPQLTLSPSTDDAFVPQASVQWFINDRLKRSRFCAEPGFVVSCVAMRPKAYVVGYDSLGGSDGIGFDPLTVLNDAIGWQPIDLDTDPHSALVAVPASYFGDTVGGGEFILDTRDVFLFGQDEWWTDQGRNRVSAAPRSTPMAPATGSRPTVVLTEYDVDCRYKFGIKSRINRDTTR